MKNRILPLVLIFLFAAAVKAQTEFGLKAGANISSYSLAASEVVAYVKPLTGYHFTGYLDIHLFRGLYIHPEVSLQLKGAKIIESQLYGGTEVIQKIMWLDLPINFVGKAPIANIGYAYAGGGPYMGFTMNAENTYSDNSIAALIIYKDNAMRSVDYGLNFLVGAKIGKRFSIYTTYRLGMANIVNSEYRWSDSVKNRVLSVGIGVSL